MPALRLPRPRGAPSLLPTPMMAEEANTPTEERGRWRMDRSKGVAAAATLKVL